MVFFWVLEAKPIVAPCLVKTADLEKLSVKSWFYQEQFRAFEGKGSERLTLTGIAVITEVYPLE
jgi:hypothetical protein